MHAISALVVSLVLACNSHSQSAVSPPDKGSSTMTSPTPTTTLEQVKRSVPKLSVGKLTGSDIDTPGVELFELTKPDAPPPPADGESWSRIVAIAGGVGQPILEDRGAIMRAVDAATKDVVVLARVGLIVCGPSAQLLLAATNDQERKRNVVAPTRTGNVIEFWFRKGGMGYELVHARLDLATGELKRIEPPPPSA